MASTTPYTNSASTDEVTTKVIHKHYEGLATVRTKTIKGKRGLVLAAPGIHVAAQHQNRATQSGQTQVLLMRHSFLCFQSFTQCLWASKVRNLPQFQFCRQTNLFRVPLLRCHRHPLRPTITTARELLPTTCRRNNNSRIWCYPVERMIWELCLCWKTMWRN